MYLWSHQVIRTRRQDWVAFMRARQPHRWLWIRHGLRFILVISVLWILRRPKDLFRKETFSRRTTTAHTEAPVEIEILVTLTSCQRFVHSTRRREGWRRVSFQYKFHRRQLEAIMQTLDLSSTNPTQVCWIIRSWITDQEDLEPCHVTIECSEHHLSSLPPCWTWIWTFWSSRQRVIQVQVVSEVKTHPHIKIKAHNPVALQTNGDYLLIVHHPSRQRRLFHLRASTVMRI